MAVRDGAAVPVGSSGCCRAVLMQQQQLRSPAAKVIHCYNNHTHYSVTNGLLLLLLLLLLHCAGQGDGYLPAVLTFLCLMAGMLATDGGVQYLGGWV